jgi:hypothetical protein
MSDPETISWRDALKLIIETGHAEGTATTMLVEAVLSNVVPYYPRRALPLGRAVQNGLFDRQTGAWRIHTRDDNPFFLRPVRSDFDRWLLKLRQPSKAGSEKKAIDFLSEKLKADHDLKREDAWGACKSEFPTLSKRRFVSHVWPQARESAGLEPRGRGGRKKTKTVNRIG